MISHIAIADAYGAGFEYSAPTPDRPNTGLAYVAHPTHHTVRPGMYTDDTQMSIAVAEVLLGGDHTPLAFADAFVAAFHRDPRDGYARGFQAFLPTTTSGADFLARIKPNSAKSGGAMRAGPVGLLADVHDVLALSALQARLTHDTPEGVAAAQAAALMVHHQARLQAPLATLPAFLDAHVPGHVWSRPLEGPAEHGGVDIVRGALHALIGATSLHDLLVRTVDVGGDVDTVAAIAMAPASVSAHLDRIVPEPLVWALEDGPYGRRFLEELDHRLAACFGLPDLARQLWTTL